MADVFSAAQSLLPGGTNYPAGPQVSPGAPGMLKYTTPTYTQPSTFQAVTPPAGTTGTTATGVDPYSQWGGRDAYNNLVTGFDSQKQNIYGTAREAAGASGTQFKGSILDFVDSLRSAQSGIDNRGVNNELARRQGSQGVMGMVGRGINSAGVMLNNKNAGDSSASGAIARAYGDIGRREMSNVNNQYEMGNREIGLAQQDLESQRASGMRRLEDSKLGIVNNIVADARNSLAALDAAMLDADLPTRIQIEQEKEAIKSQVLGELSQYDTMLREQAGGVTAMGQDARRAEATRLASLGTAPENSFQYDTEAPAEFQDTGPFSGNLPLFTFRRTREV